MNELTEKTPRPHLTRVIEQLDTAKSLTKNGVEYWTGRDLQVILAYASWAKFEAVIDLSLIHI